MKRHVHSSMLRNQLFALVAMHVTYETRLASNQREGPYADGLLLDDKASFVLLDVPE